jgi:hypothetical protein
MRERRGEDCKLIPQPVPPWEWRKRNLREWAGLFLSVGALGISRAALSGMRFVWQNKAGSGPPTKPSSLDPEPIIWFLPTG